MKRSTVARMASLIIGMVLPVTAASSQPAPAQPPTAPVLPLEYAVKLVCGRPGDSGATFVGGAYATAINVHNPVRENGLVFKVALAGLARPGPMTPFQPGIALRYDQAIEFDCRIAARAMAASGIPVPAFFTGFFVIQSRSELDVVAVYTGGPTAGQLAALHMERVPVRRVQ